MANNVVVVRHVWHYLQGLEIRLSSFVVKKICVNVYLQLQPRNDADSVPSSRPGIATSSAGKVERRMGKCSVEYGELLQSIINICFS